jgi:hypothetical protein
MDDLEAFSINSEAESVARISTPEPRDWKCDVSSSTRGHAG